MSPFRLTPTDHAALAALIQAHAERRAARIKYADHPLLADLGLIHEGPHGWAYSHETRTVEEIEADLERSQRAAQDHVARAPRTAWASEEERLAFVDRLPKKMQDAINKRRPG